MADGHFTDVELLRRELATLILEWAGKATKDDPDGPMSTALTRAVGEAARGAVAEQHQALTAETADRIAEALERRGKPWNRRPWLLALFSVVVAALFAIAFFLGLQIGRSESALSPIPAATGAAAPIAPLAPTVDASKSSPPPAPARMSEAQPPARAQRAAPASAKPASRPTPRDVGRPAPANDGAASSSTQPVGAATTPPAATTPVTKP